MYYSLTICVALFVNLSVLIVISFGVNILLLTGLPKSNLDLPDAN